MEMNGQLHGQATLSPGKGPPVGGWVGPKTGLDAVEKISWLYRKSNPYRPARSYAFWAIPANHIQ
jgi:hypothetical protein